MKTPRFYFHEPSAADKLLESAHKLKIEVLKIHGRPVASFELHGQIGELFDEDDEGEPLPPVDVQGFVGQLLAEFERAGEGGGE